MLDYTEQAMKCLENKDYEGYYENTKKQYLSTSSDEDKIEFEKASKLLSTYKEIKEFLKKDKNDYYNVLNVSRQSSPNEIKSAYNKLIYKYHPDRTRLAQSNEVFRIVQKAYMILSNPEKRRQYDMEGTGVFDRTSFRPAYANMFIDDVIYNPFMSQFSNSQFVYFNQAAFYDNLYRHVYRRRRESRVAADSIFPRICFFLFLLFMVLFSR